MDKAFNTDSTRIDPLNHHARETYIVQSPNYCRFDHPKNEKLGTVLPDGRYLVKVQAYWYNDEAETVCQEAFYAVKEVVWELLDGEAENLERLDVDTYFEVLEQFTLIEPT